MTPHTFVRTLGRIRLDGVFNPYADRCPLHDRADAARRRRANLRGLLDAAFHARIDSLWVARDLGYRGGRRTGLALTDETHLPALAEAFGGLDLRRATRGHLVSEQTATVIWSTLTRMDQPVFLWNVFPLHPFQPDTPLSNRRHSRTERKACQGLFLSLLDSLQPRRILTIGQDARKALDDLGLQHHPVRHPAYGGQREFVEGIARLYGLDLRLACKDLTVHA